MGPKKLGGKATARAKTTTPKKPPHARKKPGPKPKKTGPITNDVSVATDGAVTKRKYKPRAKKQSLVLSLQSSPAILEKSGNLASSNDRYPVIQPMPRLAPGNGRVGVNENKGFVEPALAEPKPGFSGHPLEALPPAKLKRAGTGTGRGRKWKQAILRGHKDEGAVILTQEQIDEREAGYRKHLQTVKLEKLTDESTVRHVVKGTPQKRPRLVSMEPNSNTNTTTIEIPPTPRRSGKKTGAGLGSISVKRIKIILPKRSNAMLGSGGVATPEPVNLDANDNDEYCLACGGTGVFICCDTCPKSFHLLCCAPPLRDVPEENWHCAECVSRLALTPRRVWNDVGMFGPLVNSIHGRIPTEFRLPKRLRDETFVGVKTGDENAYTDMLVKPEISNSRANGGQISGFNKDESLDIDALYDASGNPYLCHKCGLSGRGHRTLTFCDYCPLTWHLDCLPEVVCLAKTRGQKWRCPNHVESLVPPQWSERRSFRDSLVLDAAAHNNFLRLALANNFLIKHATESYFPGPLRLRRLLDYRHEQTRNFISNDTETVDAWRAELEAHPDSADETESGENVTPEYLQNFASDGRIVAKTDAHPTRLLLITNSDDPAQQPFIYRVPEHQLVLDFIHNVNVGGNTNSDPSANPGEKTSNTGNKQAILKDVRQYETRIEAEKDTDLEAVNALLAIYQNPPQLSRHDYISVLTSSSATNKSGHEEVNPKHESSNKPVSSQDALSDTEELQYIRKLVQMKGKDALLKFLTS